MEIKLYWQFYFRIMNRNMKSDDIEDMLEDKDDTISKNNPRSNPETSYPMESDDPGSQSHLVNLLDVRDQYFQPSIPSLPWSIPLANPHGAQ